jgi:hypothetical protein
MKLSIGRTLLGRLAGGSVALALGMIGCQPARPEPVQQAVVAAPPASVSAPAVSAPGLSAAAPVRAAPAPVEPAAWVRLDSGRAVVVPGVQDIAGAQNEWVSTAVRIDPARFDAATILRVSDLRAVDGSAVIEAGRFEFSQVLSVPADLNRAGYVRHLGASAGVATLPRAVLPIESRSGGISLAQLRNDGESSRLVWLDLLVPADARAGDFVGNLEVVSRRGVVQLPIRLTIYNFVLPDRRNLHLVGDVSWESLQRHFVDEFEAVTPRLVSRDDPRYARAIRVMDDLMTLAQKHRASVTIGRLQPTVKWPGTAPEVDWREYDGLVKPWLDGTAFTDKEPAGIWQLPVVDFFENYPPAARRLYLAEAASHFDALEWLARSPLWIDGRGREPSTLAASARRDLLLQANDALSAQSRVRVMMPMLTDQIDYADTEAAMPARTDAERIIALNPGPVSHSIVRTAGGERGRTPTFLQADTSGLMPYIGAGGDERDVRLWAWLGFVRGAGVVRFGQTLPTSAKPLDAADPNELVWFYPGKWFGSDRPVPTIQLKWLRRAQQDFEYLTLASARGQRVNAAVMARLLTKPVEIQPAQAADPVYSLMTGTSDVAAWDQGMKLLAQTILARRPGEPVDQQLQNALNLETLRWIEPNEKPLILGRSTLFAPHPTEAGRFEVKIGIDVYNASDTTPADNLLGCSSIPRGWTIAPAPQPIPPLAVYQVQRFGLAAAVDPDRLEPSDRAIVGIDFTQGFTRRVTTMPLVIPVAITRQREGNLSLNGSLEDWTGDDSIADRPLVKLLDRPGLQKHAATTVAGDAELYSAWAERDAYFAFKVSGLSTAPTASAQNFVRYQFRRAWGEDVVQLMVQAVYADGSLGPALHVACKPNGGQWSERKLDLREGSDDAWEPLDAGVRYATSIAGGEWRGEVAVPWRALQPPNFVEGPRRLPVMLRFNFTQHQHATGTTASWAGPIDHGRDDLFTGALILRSLDAR